MNRYVFRLEVLLVFGFLAALLILAGWGFLVAALYMGLAEETGPTGTGDEGQRDDPAL